jgi:hypothetical protein
LTVAAAEDPDGVELTLEPDIHPAVPPYRTALVCDGIPVTAFMVDDVRAEADRLKQHGVVFTREPMQIGDLTIAVFDDTCGNLIQIQGN